MTEILKQIEMVIIDAKVVEISIFEQQFHPVDGFVESRCFLVSPHVREHVDLVSIPKQCELLGRGTLL